MSKQIIASNQLEFVTVVHRMPADQPEKHIASAFCRCCPVARFDERGQCQITHNHLPLTEESTDGD